MPTPPSQSIWSVILAGGDGDRTRPFIEQWLGYHQPKPYCTFVGSRSMLQHTLDRANQLGCAGKKITVVAQDHHKFATQSLAGQQTGHIILEPDYCGTGSGIFLPLTYVRAWDPQATVVVFPSDHFVFPEKRFVDAVRRATRASTILQDRILLVGVRPTHLELEYNWMNVGGVLGWSGGVCVRQVASFTNTSSHVEVLNAQTKGALWNTGVMIGNVATFWKLGWQYLPVLMERFERLETSIGKSHEGWMLRQLYQKMPTLDFSRELLQRVPGSLGLIEAEDVLWSDWDRPERIRDTLTFLGKDQEFPSGLVATPHATSSILASEEVSL